MSPWSIASNSPHSGGTSPARLRDNPFPWLAFTGLFAALFIVVALFGLTAVNTSYVRLWDLHAHGVTVTATTTAVDKGPKGGCFYRFTVGGRTYTGGSSCADGQAVGDPVSVRYLPTRPDESTTLEIGSDATFFAVINVVAPAWFAFMGAGALWERRRRAA